MRDVLTDVERWHAAGERIALATVVSVAGSAPRGIGATLAVSERGEISGSVSGGCVEPAVIEEGMRAMRTGTPKLLKFGITEEQNVEQIGLSCGGEIRVFVERLDDFAPLAQAIHTDHQIARATVIAAPASAPDLLGAELIVPELGEPTGTLGDPALDTLAARAVRDSLLRTGESEARTYPLEDGSSAEVFYAVYPAPPSLLIVGAGHISIPLTRIAKVLGYKVIVIDAREAFATRERLPEADELLVEWPDEAMARLPISGATAVAVLTHDNKFDVPALKAALNSPAGYVGAIGSRGTREQRNAHLRDEGVTTEQIGQIFGPIGLDIGARAPEEIALAIMAQIVAARHGRTHQG
ncbi:MAG: XdhC family protein [Ktedonobacterales bacterium]